MCLLIIWGGSGCARYISAWGIDFQTAPNFRVTTYMDLKVLDKSWEKILLQWHILLIKYIWNFRVWRENTMKKLLNFWNRPKVGVHELYWYPKSQLIITLDGQKSRMSNIKTLIKPFFFLPTVDSLFHMITQFCNPVILYHMARIQNWKRRYFPPISFTGSSQLSKNNSEILKSVRVFLVNLHGYYFLTFN